MQKLKVLNSREKKALYKQLEEQFGVTEKLPYLFLENTKDKIFLLSPDFANLNVNNLNVNNKGLYFAKKERDGLRLSIEGAQLIKPKKNIISLNDKESHLWMMGKDVPMEGHKGYVIVKFNNDILGCGILKNNILRNMVPKERRLHSVTKC